MPRAWSLVSGTGYGLPIHSSRIPFVASRPRPSPGRLGLIQVFGANRPAGAVRKYLANLSAGNIALWCYLIWYLGVVSFYFDPSPAIWLNSLGISAVIGTALVLSVGGMSRIQRWQVVRLFAMPFCVSSFSALIKGRGFVLVFPSNVTQLAGLVGACGAFLVLVLALKKHERKVRA